MIMAIINLYMPEKMEGKKILESNRLILRELSTADAPFFKEIVNSDGWIKNIGDRNIHSILDAEEYIKKGPMKSYKENNFGMWLMIEKESGESIGMCGLVDRPGLEDIDIGFALLPKYYKKAFAFEAAAAVLDYAKTTLAIPKIVAICNTDNKDSINLLLKLGYHIDKKIHINDSPELYLLLPPPLK
jgi:RimJ/RimL family protein N-acetyltransferase